MLKEIENQIKNNLNVAYVYVEDQSSLHTGHLPAQQHGGGHYKVTVVSSEFVDRSLLKRHRMIYDLFKDAFQSQIHALAISAFTPEEWKEKNK